MDELLNFLVKTLVSNENEVKVEKEEDDKTITYRVKVAESDIGKVIGKNGKTASSIRTIMRSIGAKTHKKIFVKFED
ncbi:MAG: KH domain-containing protein [Clostridiales bacterium]|nr:KH domain-containing protein [Clostridiales bacterium]